MSDQAMTTLVEYQIRPETTSLDEWLQVWDLRAEDARSGEPDTSAYAEYVSDSMAAALVVPESEEASGSLVPDWERPYLSVDGTTTAEVIVLWIDPASFDPNWPAATVFKMELVEEKWLAVDAESIADKAFVPDPK